MCIARDKRWHALHMELHTEDTTEGASVRTFLNEDIHELGRDDALRRRIV